MQGASDEGHDARYDPGAIWEVKYTNLIVGDLLLDRLFAPPDRLFAPPDRLFALPDRLFALPDRLFALPDRLFALPDRLFALPDRLFALPDRLFAPAKVVWEEMEQLRQAMNPLWP